MYRRIWCCFGAKIASYHSVFLSAKISDVNQQKDGSGRKFMKSYWFRWIYFWLSGIYYIHWILILQIFVTWYNPDIVLFSPIIIFIKRIVFHYWRKKSPTLSVCFLDSIEIRNFVIILWREHLERISMVILWTGLLALSDPDPVSIVGIPMQEYVVITSCDPPGYYSQFSAPIQELNLL